MCPKNNTPPQKKKKSEKEHKEESSIYITIMYQTYVRVDLPCPILGIVYYALYALVAFVVVPVMLLTSNGHTTTASTESVVFIRTAPLPVEEEATKLRCDPSVLARGENCTVFDWLEIVDSTSDSAFVTTYIEEVLEERQCARTQSRCVEGKPIWKAIDRIGYYTAAPQEMQLVIEHRARVRDASSQHYGALNMSGMPGFLLMEPSTFAGGWTATHGGVDTFTLREILYAAGIHSMSMPMNGADWDVARRGVHIDLSLTYTNIGDRPGRTGMAARRWPSQAFYTYSCNLIPHDLGARYIVSSSSSHFLRYNGTFESRITRTHYGIHIHLQPHGVLYEASWSAALRFAAGALSLLTVPWMVTELWLSLWPLFQRKPGAAPTWYEGGLMRRFAVEKSKGE